MLAYVPVIVIWCGVLADIARASVPWLDYLPPKWRFLPPAMVTAAGAFAAAAQTATTEAQLVAAASILVATLVHASTPGSTNA